MKHLLKATPLVAVLLFPAAVGAQDARAVAVPCGWLGIGYERSGPTLVVTNVSDASPAQRAGVMVGDSVLRINGRPSVPNPHALFISGLKPGDTVHMSLRRGGRERDVRVIAEERKEGCLIRGGLTFDADSIRRMMRVYIDSTLAVLDTLRLPRIRIESGDREMIFIRPDGQRDTIYRLPLDSLQRHFERMRPQFDSARMRFEPFRPRMDSAAREMERAMQAWPHFEGSTFRWVEFGGRGVGGAELSELTPELAAYFQGASEGLLVLKVAPGTPAARAGLEAGDVIVRAAGQPVRSVAELRAAMTRAAAAGDTSRPVRLEVVRKGQRRELRLE